MVVGWGGRGYFSGLGKLGNRSRITPKKRSEVLARKESWTACIVSECLFYVQVCQNSTYFLPPPRFASPACKDWIRTHYKYWIVHQLRVGGGWGWGEGRGDHSHVQWQSTLLWRIWAPLIEPVLKNQSKSAMICCCLFTVALALGRCCGCLVRCFPFWVGVSYCCTSLVLGCCCCFSVVFLPPFKVMPPLIISLTQFQFTSRGNQLKRWQVSTIKMKN